MTQLSIMIALLGALTFGSHATQSGVNVSEPSSTYIENRGISNDRSSAAPARETIAVIPSGCCAEGGFPGF